MIPLAVSRPPMSGQHAQPSGLRLTRLPPESELSRAGLCPGDAILAIDGLVPRDVIDLQSELPGAQTLSVRLGDGSTRDLALDGQIVDVGGVELDDPLPGGIRECNNHCEFCFIRGLPPGLRPSLYTFDDDYRYSFLWGTFLTLTNLGADDWARIAYQRLSPLNVSVHATDLSVRRALLNNRRAPPILEQLRRLGELGVQVHTQIVLCAGINDGEVLGRSIHDLAELYPTVQSVSVVPVGLTRYSRVRNVRRPTSAEAEASVAICEQWQARLRPRLGVGLVYPSDELYLLAGRAEFPASAAYDGFPVLANGVGMLRAMLDEWERLIARRRRRPNARCMVWLSGQLAAPALERMAERWQAFAGWKPMVRVVENHTFGNGTSVSGLLTGADLIAALRDLPSSLDDVVVPRSAFGYEGARTLDGVAAEDIGQAHRGRVHLASTPAELLDILYA